VSFFNLFCFSATFVVRHPPGEQQRSTGSIKWKKKLGKDHFFDKSVTLRISVKAKNRFKNSIAGKKLNSRYKLTDDPILFEKEARSIYVSNSRLILKMLLLLIIFLCFFVQFFYSKSCIDAPFRRFSPDYDENTFNRNWIFDRRTYVTKK